MDFEEEFFSEDEEEEELFLIDSEDHLLVEELEKIFKECSPPPSAEKITSHEEPPLSLEEVLTLVEYCENFINDKFHNEKESAMEKEILPQDAPYLEPQEYSILVDFLRRGRARINFKRKPTDFMAGLFLYQQAFPELELNLPPKKKYPLYYNTPKYFSPPVSKEYQLGIQYYDLGEIAFKQCDYINFFSCALASSYYGYPLGVELLHRILIGLRLKNLVQEEPPKILTSKKSLLLAGHCYLTGIASVANEEQAYLMYRALAERKNSSKGNLALAMCYLEGIGVESNYDIAVNLLEKAVDQGNQTAIYQLIFIHLLDESNDFLEKAVELCKHPTIQGQTLSCFLLSLFYTYGIGTEPDVDRGLYFTEKSGNYEIQTLGTPLRIRIMNLLEE